MKKLIAVVVILLFLGLAYAPSINANVSRDNELVEITTEIYGLDGGKHTIQLTKAEVEVVELIFDEIKNLIFSSKKVPKTLSSGLVFKEGSENESFNCLVVGKTTWTNFFFKKITTEPPTNPRMELHLKIFELLALLMGGFQGPLKEIIFSFLAYVFAFRWILYILGGGFFKPISFAENVYFGIRNYDNEYVPAEGWIRALGLDGLKKWDGTLFGRLGGHSFALISRFKGIENFYGIKLFTPKGVYFVGIASHVKLGKNPIWYPI